VGGQQRPRAVEHPGSRPLELAKNPETRFDAVEGPQDVQTSESDLPRPDPVEGSGWLHEARGRPERAGSLYQASVRRSDTGRDDGEAPHGAGMVGRTDLHHE
jgi:hypothetical protein